MATTERVPRDRPLEPDDWPLASERRYARRQVELAEHYNLAVESRAVETESAGRVHYLELGDPEGEPVLFLHGVGSTAATWLPMLPSLAEEYRLVVPDRPGRGLSRPVSYEGRNLRSFMVAYLLELLDDLGVDRPHVVGNSLGGQQAFLLAIDHDRVDRICLVGAPAGLTRDLPAWMRLTTVRGLNRVMFWLLDRGDPVESARESMETLNVVDDSAIPEAFYAVIAANGELPGRTKSMRSLATEQGSWGTAHPIFDLRSEIVTIERPTAFVWGDEDSVWTPDVGRPVAERMPDARFYVLSEHGHMPWMEPGDEVETLVREFLDE